MPHYRKRVDANQAAIVQAMRALGWYVFDASSVGRGFPDLIAAKGGAIVLVEVKDGSKPKSEQALTPAEAKVHRDFAAAGVPVLVTRSVDDWLSTPAQVAAIRDEMQQ